MSEKSGEKKYGAIAFSAKLCMMQRYRLAPKREERLSADDKTLNNKTALTDSISAWEAKS